MQKFKLFSVLLSFVIMAITFVSCNTKEGESLGNIYNTVADTENESESEEEVSSEDSNLDSNTDVNDIDTLLNEYEKTVNQYNDYKERISEGDITVIAEAPALLERAQDLKAKFEKIKDNMTAEQIARLSVIISNM
ncbi:hypothetical protein EG240_05810 [Paenimyroides tangerinum]|uniref:Lipoprotein n=1 Tax=Paenimyroides tangerinum TaxID=2488728 RepID=A0A3P3W955_9FLAO|nr:hypothetical protein [Paenimyroides tangerinum]RRJ91520.1 hypothetical protein EG240_05810 [Paenimyroides tangerinum]